MNNNLTKHEISTLKQLKASKIPDIFKNELLDFLILVENIHIYITEDLIKGKHIKYDCRDEFKEMQDKITNINLTKQDKFYLNELLKVYNIYVKFYKKQK